MRRGNRRTREKRKEGKLKKANDERKRKRKEN